MDTLAPNRNVSRGLCLTVGPEQLPVLAELHRRLERRLVDAVAEVCGEGRAEALRRQGLGRLHAHVRADQVGAIRDRVIEGLREALLGAAVDVGRSVLGWRDEFYVDDYIILRINLPFEAAREADPKAENPGIGRVSPAVRELASARKVIDPVYDPKGYHRGYPPAAWAHGPHIDSWAGHSRDGVNIWWAVSDVPEEAGMVLYPELAGEAPPCDRRTLYVRAGYPLPRPTYKPLAAGEMLVFDPEILHGTHLNVTDGTRVAVSLRLNARKPVFDPACFYAREFWRRASDITAGRDEVLHLKREDNLEAPPPSTLPREPAPVRIVKAQRRPDRAAWSAPLAEGLAPGERLLVELGEEELLLVRAGEGLAAFQSRCPHYGLSFADGAVEDGKVFCPGCAVKFDLATGRSACASLRLRVWEAVEDAGAVRLTPPHPVP